mgnify:FL=1
MLFRSMFDLTPAYDICPQPRHGRTASQAMIISDNDRSSRIVTCVKAAPHFLLSEKEALQIVDQQIHCITDNWTAVCDEALLSEVDRNLLWGNQFLNPFVFEGLASGKFLRPNVPFGQIAG